LPVSPERTASRSHDRSQAQQALRLHGLTTALAQALTPGDVARAVVEYGLETLGASAGSVWSVEPTRRVLRRAFELGTDPKLLREFPEVPLEPAVPLPVTDAIRTGAPVWIDSREELARRYPEVHRLTAGDSDVASAAILPLRVEGRAIGALTYSWNRPREPSEEGRALKLLVAQICAQSLARAALFDEERRARADAERLREHAAFLAKASALLAASVEIAPTVQALAHLAVPRFADWCVVQLARAVADTDPVVAHVDPAKVALAGKWSRRYPPRGDEPTGPQRVLRTGRAELYPEITDAMLAAAAHDEEHLATLRQLQMRSAMAVPLNARGRTLGVITFIRTESDFPYGTEELTVAEDLAHRAALAIDNARLIAEAREAARARDEFLSIASHELRNPLNALQMVLVSISRGAAQRPELCTPQWVSDKLERAERQLGRVTDLVDNLLDVSRLSTGRRALATEPRDRGERAPDGVARQGHHRGPGQLRIAATGPVVGEWDRLRIGQVLANLLGNAIKYGQGKPIDLEIADDGDTARIVVRDRGIGIPAHLHQRIFERFERGVGDRGYAGFGLGLWIARLAVEASGGSVSLESSPGAGARFEVRLPKHPPAAGQRRGT
jgi:signal transduction histidine kinase